MRIVPVIPLLLLVLFLAGRVPVADAAAPRAARIGAALPAVRTNALPAVPPVQADRFSITGRIGLFNAATNALSDFSDVVVYVESVNSNAGFRPSGPDPVIVNRNMSFVPSVLPVLAGTRVRFDNDDLNPHNVYSLSVVQPFDLGISDPGTRNHIVFPRPGLVKVYCNIHSRMIAYILVLGNPYFARPGPDGSYAITNLAAGTYRIACWYRYGGTDTRTVTGTNAYRRGGNVDFRMVRTHDDPLHKNKWGGTYKGKY